MTHRNSLLTVSLLGSAALLATMSLTTFAQPAKPAGAGLDALDESTVRVELAGRGFEDLLNRSFEVDNVPEAQRKNILSGLALQRLANVDVNTLNARQRKDLVARLGGNLDKVIGSMKDPGAISKLALKIMQLGVITQVSLIEFWGEDPATQAELRPAAEAVLKLYAKAEEEISTKIGTLANVITSPNDPRLDQIDRLTNDQLTMQYSKMNTHYPVAISLDKADPRRQTLADEAITYLGQYDNETSGVQPAIKLTTGKLLIAKGDFEAAKKKLEELWKDPTKITPAPAPEQVASARQFTAIADLLAGNADAAEKLLKENETWREANVTNKDNARLIADASAVLQARIHWQRAEKAASPAEKQKHNDAAAAVLTQLVKERPQLASTINDELIKRLPATADMSKLDTLLLQALVGRGRSEIGVETPDKDRLTKGLAAAKELLKRKGQPGVDDKAVETTLITIPLMAQKLGDNKAAAEAFLDYVEFPKADPDRRKAAMEAALGIILGDLQGGRVADQDVAKLYDRAMPMAINPPFNYKKDLAYIWGRRMQKLQQIDEAIKYLRLVPADDPRLLQSKYYLAIALNAKLDDPKLPAKDRSAYAAEIVKIAGEVDKAAAAGLATAKDDKQRNQFKAMLGGVKITSAFVALDVQNQPQQALDILKDLEAVVAGMPGAENMITDATGVRIRALMALGRDTEAFALLEDFSKKREKEAIGLVAQLNQRIGKEIDKAKADKNTQRVATLAPMRAKLTERLANYIRNHPDPKIRAQTFAADSQLADVKREAALLENDPKKRVAQLKEVTKIYDRLLASPDAKSNPAVEGRLTGGLGFISFDVGEYQKCIDLLMPLLRARRLGGPFNIVNGKQEDNIAYWEARFKVLRSFVELGKQQQKPEMIEEAAKELRLVYAGNRTPGGLKWGDEFEKLRKEIAPDINPNAGLLGQPEPTTQPGGVEVE